jgi:hypothetical protein
VAEPPVRPALMARSRLLEKLRFSAGTLAPPRAAISRRRSGSMAAKPRLALGFSGLGDTGSISLARANAWVAVVPTSWLGSAAPQVSGLAPRGAAKANTAAALTFATIQR